MSTEPQVTIILNSRNIVFGSRKQVADMLDVTPDTVSDLVKRGVIPPPFNLSPNPAKREGKGYRNLSWDLHEVAECILKSRRGPPHPALNKHR